jgi:hypothetical protein
MELWDTQSNQITFCSLKSITSMEGEQKRLRFVACANPWLDRMRIM